MSFSKILLFTLSVAGLLTFAGMAQAQNRGFGSRTAPHVSSAKQTSTQMASHRFHNGDRDFDNRRFHRSNNFVFFGAFGYPYGYGYNSDGYGSPPYGTYYNGAAPPVYSGEATGYGGSSVIAQVQQILAGNGYYHGAIDGVIGSGTRGAIRAYERAHGLAVDGRINRQLLAKMGLA